MSWIPPIPLLLVAGLVALGFLALALQRWSLSLLIQLTLTALLTLAVLMAIGVAWSVLWWLVHRWGE